MRSVGRGARARARARLEDYDDLAAPPPTAAGFSPADRAPGGAAFGGFAGTEEDGRSADSVQREMARLIAEARASPETRRVLVAAASDAAAGGAERPRDIVALMAVTTEGVREDARVWAETHDLAAYDDFAKPEEAAAKKAEAAAATENAGRRRRAGARGPPRFVPSSGGTGTGTGTGRADKSGDARVREPRGRTNTNERRVPRHRVRVPPRVRARDASALGRGVRALPGG